MKDLLSPSTTQKIGTSGVEETRPRAFALLAKVFLHYLNQSNFSDDKLWWQILNYAETYIGADESELLVRIPRLSPQAEAVHESLKNMILVMSASGLLVPDGALWTNSWERIDTFSS